jgi:hypothetical protein
MRPGVRVTPYPDVDEAVRELFESVREILGDHLLAVYLEGSLAAGGFDPERSDIDLVVVTTDFLPDDLLPRLKEMHLEMAAGPSPWATEVEVTYAPQRGLRRFDPDDVRPWPNIERGRPLGMWIPNFGWTLHLYGLRRHAIVLHGPEPSTLVDPVTSDDLCRVVARGAREWLTPYVEDPASLHLEARAFVVLTACRMLYTLETGEIAPKPLAGAWARDRLDGAWTALIDSTLRWRKHHTDDASISLPDTIALIRFVQKQVAESVWSSGRG